jgi:hypothetical protein
MKGKKGTEKKEQKKKEEKKKEKMISKYTTF